MRGKYHDEAKRIIDLATLTAIYLRKEDLRQIKFIRMTFNQMLDDIVDKSKKKTPKTYPTDLLDDPGTIIP